MSDDKILFEAADKNKDGSLNKAEFLMFSHPEEHPDMLPVILKQTLQDKDTDGDGFISFQEFVGDRGKAFHHLNQCITDGKVIWSLRGFYIRGTVLL